MDSMLSSEYADQIKIEERSNKYAVRNILYICVIILIIWLLNIMGIFVVDRKIMNITVVSSLAALIVPVIVCRFTGVSGKWVKYMLIACVGVAATILGTFLTYHAVYAAILPIFIAAQYRKKKVLYIAFVLTVICLYISALGGYFYGICDMNMTFMSNNTISHYVDFGSGAVSNISVNPNPWVSVTIFFVLPRAIILFLFSIFVKNIINNSSKDAAMIKEMAAASETDPSTRFYNKDKYDRMCSEYYVNTKKIGVIFYDINDFAKINNDYGRTQGDFVLSIFARCLYVLLSDDRKVYRIGGDEFVMIVENPGENELSDIISQINQKIAMYNDTAHIKLSAALGTAEGAGADVLSVIYEAEKNMKHDKQMTNQLNEKAKSSTDILNDKLFEAMVPMSDHLYVFICDMNTNVSRWAKPAVEYFGMPGEYMHDAYSIWLEHIHPEDRPEYERKLNMIFSGEKRVNKCEYRARNKDGEYVWIESRGSVVYDKERDCRFFAGVMIRLDNRNKYDPLTKMRSLYEFNKLDFDSGKGSLLLIGIDDFRKVVNNFGYSYGDKIIAQFARRILDYCGSERQAYRLEGDEFIIHSVNEDMQGTIQLFEDLKDLSYELGNTEKRTINLKFTGSAILYPDNGTDRSNILGNLEHSLEYGKDFNRGELTLYSDEIADAHKRTMVVRDEIFNAVQNDFKSFEMYYQPIVSSRTGKIVSCEALLRYHDSSGFYIDLGEVIQTLEDSGEINRVGDWIIQNVFKTAHEWQQKMPDLKVGFNVSMVQFRNPDFVDYVIQMSKDYKVDPHRINIELTETCRIADFELMGKYVMKLRDYGFKIALDDFGMEYSTLMLLKAFPADYIKIDKNFIKDMSMESNTSSRIIVEAVTWLGNKLGLTVIAEGVEDEKILNAIRKYNIDMYQGFYFSRPVSADAFEDILKKQ